MTDPKGTTTQLHHHTSCHGPAQGPLPRAAALLNMLRDNFYIRLLVAIIAASGIYTIVEHFAFIPFPGLIAVWVFLAITGGFKKPPRRTEEPTCPNCSTPAPADQA